MMQGVRGDSGYGSTLSANQDQQSGYGGNSGHQAGGYGNASGYSGGSGNAQTVDYSHAITNEVYPISTGGEIFKPIAKADSSGYHGGSGGAQHVDYSEQNPTSQYDSSIRGSGYRGQAVEAVVRRPYTPHYSCTQSPSNLFSSRSGYHHISDNNESTCTSILRALCCL